MINRVIPCLLIKDDVLVKTYKFKTNKYVGDPINTIKIFNEKEVDEIIVLDISASKNNKEPNFQLIKQLTSECFMPICYGGGIRTIEHANRLFDLGVEKISMQSILFHNLDIAREMCDYFGSQAIVASVDIKRNYFNKYFLYNSSTKQKVNIKIELFIESLQSAGIGEIIVNAVDNDGVMKGVNMELISFINQHLNIPLIAMGGVGKFEDIVSAINSGADAVGVGAYFVFNGPYRAVLISYPKREKLNAAFSVL